MPVIRVESGPAKGTIWEIETSGQLVLGRDAHCGAPLSDDAASREHARLEFDGRQLVLQDLDSTNHTFVNGHQVDRRVLQAGDEIRIGGTRLSVSIGQQDSDQSSPPLGAPDAPVNTRASLLRILLITTLVLSVIVVGIAILGGGTLTDPGKSATPASPRTSGTGDSSTAQQSDTRVAPGVSPDRARATELYTRGLTSYQLGQLAQAVSMLEEAARLMPEDTDIAEALGRATARYNTQIESRLQQAGAALEALRFDEARRALRAAIELLGDKEDDPRMLEARQLLRRLE